MDWYLIGGTKIGLDGRGGADGMLPNAYGTSNDGGGKEGGSQAVVGCGPQEPGGGGTGGGRLEDR
jgi:hypothetical protein